MNEITKKRLLAAGLGIAAIILTVVFLRATRSTEVAPSTDGYYTGPMRNKRGDLVTEDGRILERAAPGQVRARPGAMPGAQ